MRPPHWRNHDREHLLGVPVNVISKSGLPDAGAAILEDATSL